MIVLRNQLMTVVYIKRGHELSPELFFIWNASLDRILSRVVMSFLASK